MALNEAYLGNDAQPAFHEEDPMRVLLRRCELEPRRPHNAPHYVLRTVTFLAPSAAIYGLGCLGGPNLQQVALTVAGSLLGVQLAGPYRAASRRLVSFYADMKHERRSLPRSLWRSFWANTFDAKVERRWDGRRLSYNKLYWLKLRTRLIERAWKRHFTPDFAQHAPISGFEEAWGAPAPLQIDWQHHPRLPGLRRHRAARVLRKVGRLLRKSELLEHPSIRAGNAPDAPARHLATQRHLPYK